MNKKIYVVEKFAHLENSIKAVFEEHVDAVEYIAGAARIMHIEGDVFYTRPKQEWVNYGYEILTMDLIKGKYNDKTIV